MARFDKGNPGDRESEGDVPAQAAAGPDAPQPTAGRRRRAPRRPALERREEFVAEAAAFFAEQGFAAGTRALAERLGVRQALLYRYFPSKDALVEAVFARVFGQGWDDDFATLLAGRERPLEERLAEVYRRYAGRDHGLALRLMLRAALDGHPVPRGRGAPVTDQIIAPLVAELRHEARLPALAHRPMLKEERDMVMMLHAAVVFHGIREHVYRQNLAAERDEVMTLYCETFLAGAREQVRSLHGRPGLSQAMPGRPRTALARLRMARD